jgi:hypothetical protein
VVVFAAERQTAYLGLTLQQFHLSTAVNKGLIFRETDLLSGEFNAIMEYSACASNICRSHLKRHSREVIVWNVFDLLKRRGKFSMIWAQANII